MTYTMNSDGEEYFSITQSCENNIKSSIAYWFSLEDAQRRMNCNMHVTIQDAYEHVLHELSTMDHRFYTDFDARKLRKSPKGKDWAVFAVPELMKMLDIIYWTRNYTTAYDDEPVENDDSEFNEQSSWVEPYQKSLKELRKRCACLIWKEWAYEKLWGPRCGVILFSITDISVTKVLLAGYSLDGIYHYSFPKGKPNIGETKRMTAFREFNEETGIDILDFYIYLDEGDGEFIKKCPHIGPVSRRRSREHYYIMTKISVEYTKFRPSKDEVSDVEWHSVYTLPCSVDCQVRIKYKDINGSRLPVNYHMVTLRDIDNENSAIRNILDYMENNGSPDARINYHHAHRKCAS